MFDLEAQINSWRDHLRARGNFTESDISELESHLRDEIDDLITSGLSPDEAFLISVKRLGNADAISREYAKVNTANLWKHFMLDPVDPQAGWQNRRDIIMVVLFSLLAGTLIKLPELLSLKWFTANPDLYYVRNLSLFILPFISVFFLVKRGAETAAWRRILGIFALSAVLINLYPSYAPHHTAMLSGMHLAMFLWLLTGVAYIGRDWQGRQGRMNFIRFSGESFIYAVLVMAGVVVLGGFIIAIFKSIGIDAERFFEKYLIIYGGCAAALISIYLADAKKSVVENFAPILAKIFSPLFLLAMIVFLAVMVATGQSPFAEREFLIAFDFMLAMILGLVLYVISARDINQPVNLIDYLNLALILTALIIDAVALSAIVSRLQAFGITPNKVAALGENLILLGNLAGLAWMYVRYFKRRISFVRLEKWQTDYLNVYVIWTAFVAFAFPVIFKFV